MIVLLIVLSAIVFMFKRNRTSLRTEHEELEKLEKKLNDRKQELGESNLLLEKRGGSGGKQ